MSVDEAQGVRSCRTCAATVRWVWRNADEGGLLVVDAEPSDDGRYLLDADTGEAREVNDHEAWQLRESGVPLHTIHECRKEDSHG